MAEEDNVIGPLKKHSYDVLYGAELVYPNATLHELLSNCAEKHPKAIALCFGGQQMTYAVLQEKIHKTARYLASNGVIPGQTIAISLDRSPEFIVTLFAILQCGAAYVPLDTGYPDPRMELMIDDAKASFFICNENKGHLSHYATTIFVDDIIKGSEKKLATSLKLQIPSTSTAYVIYTSGSTGKPKGVRVAHRNVLNLVYSMGQEPGIRPGDKIFAVTTISFDAMVMEIFLPLLHGATVVLVDEDTRRDGKLLLKKALDDEITMMWGTPSIWQILLDSEWEKPLRIKALIGGEAVPKDLTLKLLNRCSELWNIYGPTETTVCSFLTKITETDDPITIGKPVANTQAYFLDKSGNPVGKGEVGEIAIGGDGVSLGYIDRPELMSARFIDNPFEENAKSKLYLSGDLGKILENGEVQCLGRIDDQVKVRGHRIELGEIETVLSSFTDIKRATVIVSTRLKGEPRLVAYLQSSGNRQDLNAVRTQLEEMLPDFMVPSFYMWVDDFPITTNGKIDKKKLPLPEYIRPSSAPLLKHPRTELQKKIAVIWSEQLQLPEIGIDDNFFELGGTSLLTQRTVTALNTALNREVPVTKIYQFPTIATLSEFLENEGKTKSSVFPERKKHKTNNEVAVIGMAGRFPGADSIEALWEVLREGKETISFFTREELDTSLSESLRNDPLYVAARGVVPSVRFFDASFFGINPKMAEAMDPQQRLFLEIAWEALEQAGHLPENYKGSIGVYAGTGTNTYYQNNILPNKELIEKIGVLQASTVNEKDYIATRTAYHLNLKGPAVSVQSACSTSLLAIAEAVEAIRNGHCDVALAGGSSITAPINSGHLYQEGSMLSSDGHCKSFDADGKGTVFSDGAGVVLLKSLDAALEDGDFIYGLVKGVGINNDGGGKGSFTAPSAEGQADAIDRAFNDAQISPSTISYIEAHGTATPVGDPIEIEGLQMAFGPQEKKGYCAIGSIKSNMGHLTAAAGVAGFIKTVLAMNHHQIPPSLGFKKPNPLIDFKNSPFFVNNELRPWNSEGAKRAGVSSFGVGGTNVHIILEEYEMKPQESKGARPFQLLAWSAKTESSLEGYQTALEQYVKKAKPTSLADIAYSLHVTRNNFNHRSFIVAEDTQVATEELGHGQEGKIKTNTLKAVPEEVVFLFPGQGAQFVQMGKALYEHEAVFRKAVDTCAKILETYLKLDIRNILYSDTGDGIDAEALLKNTRYTQPALFVVEYALSQLWMSWGIKPTILCGHSIGEFVGAHLAGIFTLKDALRLIAVRGRLVSELPEGDMLSVRLEANALRKLVPSTLSIAAINSGKLCVVSGHTKDIEEFSKELDQKNIPNKQLATSHAFHSFMMDPVLDTFKAEVEKTALHTPLLRIVSTVTGEWLTDSEATDPQYWTDHLRNTVKFVDAANTILSLKNPVLLEVGPGQTLTTLIRQRKEGRVLTTLSSLPKPKENEGAYPALLNALGELWGSGVAPDWHAFYKGQSRIKVSLPAYVFDRKPCWVEPLSFHQNIIPTLAITDIPNTNQNVNQNKPMRKAVILQKISEIIDDASGIDVEGEEYKSSFLELGLDSLILTQFALTCKKEFGIPITFRQLNEDYNSPERLAIYLDECLPEDQFASKAPEQSGQFVSAPLQATALNGNYIQTGNQNSALGLISQQIQFLGRQIELLQGKEASNMSVPIVTNDHTATPPATNINLKEDTRTAEEKSEHSKPFGASPRIEKRVTGMSAAQQDFLQELTSRYNNKTNSSKAYAQKHRSRMSDPRVVSGFKPLTKELVYPLVIEKSSGNRLWDLDGNEYIDALNGFGSCIFGHQPDFIKDALKKQVDLGYEVGPQHPLAGEVCDLLCEFTGHERAALCNTGSEAVLGTMRIARTVTGRSLIVAFKGSYHGINDEALVRGSKKLRTFPAAPGHFAQRGRKYADT